MRVESVGLPPLLGNGEEIVNRSYLGLLQLIQVHARNTHIVQVCSRQQQGEKRASGEQLSLLLAQVIRMLIPCYLHGGFD